MTRFQATSRLAALCLGAGALALGCGDINVPGIATPDAQGDTGSSDVVTPPTGDPAACETYCEEVTNICTDANEQFTSKSICLNYCKTWAGLPAGEDGAQSGNSAACRTYHAGVAAGGAKSTHCPHAGPTGGDTCGTWCDNYCHLALRNCTGALELYKNDAECRAACATIATDGDNDANEGDSIQCRINNLILAQTEPGLDAKYCPRGARDGGDTCATLETCETYCAEIMKNCTGGNEQYLSEQICLNYCEFGSKMPKGAVGTQTGNTVACRTYHAGLAGLSDPGDHCRHAGPSGGDTCGSWCEVYCQLAQTNCQGEFALYPDLGECTDVCGHFATDGSIKAESGDSVQCRIFYAGRAGIEGEASAITQCPEAQEWSATCIDPLPAGCIGGTASTIDDCVSCAAAVDAAAGAVADLVGLYASCDTDADCVVADATTDCGGGCDVAINGQFAQTFDHQVKGVSGAYCADFAVSGSVCGPVSPVCTEIVPKCVGGTCKAMPAP
jgi:hypothetical protein